MKRFGLIKGNLVFMVVGLLTLGLVVACGSASQPETSSQSGTTDPGTSSSQPASPAQAPQTSESSSASDTTMSKAIEAGQATSSEGVAPANLQAAPTAEAMTMESAPEEAMVKPEGTLNTGLKEMGPFFLHPSTLGNPQIFVHGTAPIGEGLLQQNLDREVLGLLAESWEISDDFLTWTFKLHEGVQFHKGYGEMKAEDVVWSMQQWGLSKHPRAGQLTKFWEDREGSEIVDDYTLKVHTGEPVVGVIAERWHMTPGGASTFTASKRQTEELGVDEASTQIAVTGPWEIVEHKTGEFWKMEAVEDHWRHTPEFAEFIMWEIPEESSRLAGFQTGNLDTFLMSFDSIPRVLDVEGAQLMTVPNAVEMGLRIYGNWYPIEGVDTRPGYDPELPWVSPTDDITHPDWMRARNVRLALVTAIDRQALVDTILSGHGHIRTPVRMYTGFEHYLDGRDWEFNPDKAKQLLAEAGYPEGFEITLTPSLRGAPAEVEGCEVIAQMWGDVGIDVNFQRVPYGTLRPQLVGRTYQGATCHAGSPLPTPAGGYGSYLSENPFNRGLEHHWAEDKMRQAQSAVDPAEREQLEREVGQFLFDNVMTDVNYYTIDAVWPVGPRIEPWTEYVRTTDVRQVNGYEYIKHRR